MIEKYKQMSLKNQLCFPLYVCSKEIVRQYKPFLDEVDLTYTQYIVMLAMWEHKNMNVRELGELLYLDSGTLTPVLKKLESKGLVRRERSKVDERIVNIVITDEGYAMKKVVKSIPMRVWDWFGYPEEDADKLYDLLYQAMEIIDKHMKNK